MQASSPCPQCGDTLRRKYSISTPAPNHYFQPHFNISIGQHVNSMADFKSKLSAKSDQMSERLGIDHNYQPVEPHSSLTVNED